MPWFDGQGGNPPPFSPGYLVEGTQPATTFAAGLGLMLPFFDLAKINVGLMLNGNFGLGPLMFDAKAQLSAALSASISWNPQAAIQAHAAIGLQLSGFIPNLNINASIAADLQLKIGGIQLLINLGLNVMLSIPPLFAAVSGFMQLPGGYFGCYYGPAAGVRPMNSVATLVGGGDMGCIVMAFGMPKAGFQAAVGGLFATSP